jgi:hypothetical protein
MARDWRCGSSGRIPPLQAQSPEFKLQNHQKKKKCLERKVGTDLGREKLLNK